MIGCINKKNYHDCTRFLPNENYNCDRIAVIQIYFVIFYYHFVFVLFFLFLLSIKLLLKLVVMIKLLLLLLILLFISVYERPHCYQEIISEFLSPISAQSDKPLPPVRWAHRFFVLREINTDCKRHKSATGVTVNPSKAIFTGESPTSWCAQ